MDEMWNGENVIVNIKKVLIIILKEIVHVMTIDQNHRLSFCLSPNFDI